MFPNIFIVDVWKLTVAHTAKHGGFDFKPDEALHMHGQTA